MNVFSSTALLGCSICWGSDGTTLDAANAAVLFMLVLLVGVLGSFLSFIFYLRRRARMVAAEADLISAFSSDIDDADVEDEVITPSELHHVADREPEMVAELASAESR